MHAAAHDTTVAERLLRVTHLIDPPTRLQDPALVPSSLRQTCGICMVRYSGRRLTRCGGWVRHLAK